MYSMTSAINTKGISEKSQHPFYNGQPGASGNTKVGGTNSRLFVLHTKNRFSERFIQKRIGKDT